MDDVRLNGLYGGLRLVKATIKVFAEYCWREKIRLPQQNFSLRYETDIPRQVGLGGSSAIITAAMRSVAEFYQVSIPREILPGLVLSVETEEIGIDAGLQDRVCQVYEGLVYMDFNRETMSRLGHGLYESLDPGLLPPLYLAFRNDLSRISGIYHSDLRGRWNRGERAVHRAMEQFADLARQGRECLLQGDAVELARLVDRELRYSIRAVQVGSQERRDGRDGAVPWSLREIRRLGGSRRRNLRVRRDLPRPARRLSHHWVHRHQAQSEFAHRFPGSMK